MNEGQNRVIIDSGQIIYNCINGNKILDEAGNPVRDSGGRLTYTDKTLEEVQHHIDNSLMEIFIALQAGEYLGFVDTRSDLSFRRDLDSRYKSSRIGKEPPKWIKEAKQYLIDSWTFFPTNNCLESDDLCLIHKEYYKDLNPILVTADKDLKYSEGISWDIKSKTLRTNSEYDELHNFWMQMICGDEDLPGIPGLGKKKGKSLLEGLTDNEEMRNKVLGAYISYYGEVKGINEFYIHYNCLKIRKTRQECPCDVEIQSWIQVPGTY